MNNQLFSTKVNSKARDYFFDVKQSQNGRYYLVINESRKSEEGNNKRQCVLVFNNLLTDFAAAFAQSMQKISELDPSIIWNPHSDHQNKPTAISANNDTSTKKRRYRDMSKSDIEQEQLINMRNGKPKNAGLRWSDIDRQKVKQFHANGEPLANIARALQRSIPSITAELMKQGLLQETTAAHKPF